MTDLFEEKLEKKIWKIYNGIQDQIEDERSSLSESKKHKKEI